MIADSLGGGATSTSLHLQGDVADVAGVSAEFLRGKECHEVTENGSPACRGAFMKVDKARRSDISHARKVHKLEDVHRCSMYPLPNCQESQFGEVFILGMPFLRYYFTVFDRANKQVGTLLRYAVLYGAVPSISFSGC